MSGPPPRGERRTVLVLTALRSQDSSCPHVSTVSAAFVPDAARLLIPHNYRGKCKEA